MAGLDQFLFRDRRDRPIPAWMVFSLIYACIFLTHLSLLRLPYFWDEAGYYIPAAYDFLRRGSLIPYSTLPNAHPPLPAIYLALWWKLSGFAPAVTRLAICLVAALGLTGVFALSRKLMNTPVAVATTLLTGLYPVWFTQSTMAHADIYAAAATLWGLFYALDPLPSVKNGWKAAAWFSVAALSKETAIMTPLALAGWHIWEVGRRFGNPAKPGTTRGHWRVALQFCVPVLPLAAWYGYYFHKTGYMFGNPEYVHYNARATLHWLRFGLALGQRLMQITIYMNLFVPVLCMVAAMFLPALLKTDGTKRPRVSWNAQAQIGIILLVNVLFFSMVGGAVLARYLLPLYPLILLVCVSTWRRRLIQWPWLVGLSAVAFIAGLYINPPYRFAPEDNLTYRSMIVMQQQAIAQIEHKAAGGTVLTAWPATDELTKPELGYVRHPMRVIAIDNFSFHQIEAARRMDGYDAALAFATKYNPPRDALGPLSWFRLNDPWNEKYFGYHHDLPPETVARLLGGKLVWKQYRSGMWAAVVLFSRSQQAARPAALDLYMAATEQ